MQKSIEMNQKNVFPTLKIHFLIYISCLFGISFYQTAFATTTVRQTKSFREVLLETENALKKVSNDKVLVVFDIDNTLLTMSTNMGSDQWYAWQSDLIKQKKFEDAVGNSTDDLQSAQGVVFNLGRMHPPEPEIPNIVKDIQKTKVHTLVLTSRGNEYRSVTERELKRNGFEFTGNSIGPTLGYAGLYLPGCVEKSTARMVSFTNGVFMGAGQHKGQMLRCLLKKTKSSNIKKIIFVDDSERNIKAVSEIMDLDKIDIVSLHYTAMSEQIQAFEKGDKKIEKEAWQEILKIQKKYFH
jgi:hypothetical protein